MLIPILLLTVAACVRGHHDTSCDENLPNEELDALSNEGTLFPDMLQLERICPGFLSYSRCFQHAMKDEPEHFNEENIGVYRSLNNSFGELCTEGTELRRYYLLHVECLKPVESQWPTCLDTSKKVYEEYREKEGQNKALPGEEQCFRRGYALGCMSEKVYNKCEPDTVDLFQIFMKKYDYLSIVCEVETAEALKTKYLEYLNLTENQEKLIYKNAFNLAS